jgi:hypothetical protein
MNKVKSTLEELLLSVSKADADENFLNENFPKIAEHLFFKGHLKAGDKTIYIYDVEFYFHQEKENGSVKDEIMYRTNDRLKQDGKPGQFDYFPVGTIHVHNSGLDIMFDNEQRKIRGGILVRGIFIENQGDINLNPKPDNKHESGKGRIEDRPTFMYGELLSGASIFSSDGLVIKWIDGNSTCNEPQKIKSSKRKNVRISEREWRFWYNIKK